MPVALLTAGYAVFQTANNTTMMATIGRERRGTIAGLVSLARNLGLLTGASAMGAVFAFVSAGEQAVASPEAVAAGMRATFAVATAMVTVGWLVVVARGEALGFRSRGFSTPGILARSGSVARPESRRCGGT